MNNDNQLGKNIRSLRLAYGETQEQLGEILHVEKNTVSYYENGKREPSKKTLSEIASHYMVSVGELLHSDLTSIGTITVDNTAFRKNIETIFPIVSSERALENENFKKAFDAHKSFYNKLHKFSLNKMDFDQIDNIDICFDEYSAAAEDNNIKAETEANFIALWYFYMMCMKSTPEFITEKPAPLMQVVARDEKARKILENTDSSLEADTKEILSEIYNDEMKDRLSKMLTDLKRSKKLSDLADYYLALQYVYNLVDNDLDWGYNIRIGVEMLNAFITVGNVYAAKFIIYNYNAIHGVSSQSVDDI